VRLKFAGAQTPERHRRPRKQLPGKEATISWANDPKKWHTNVPNYAAAQYRGIYPGVDAVFHGDNQRMEFDFNVAPGAKSRRDRNLEIQGAKKINIDKHGNAVLHVGKEADLTLRSLSCIRQWPAGAKKVAGKFCFCAEPITSAFALGSYEPLAGLLSSTPRSSPTPHSSVMRFRFGIAGGRFGRGVHCRVDVRPEFFLWTTGLQDTFSPASDSVVISKLNASGQRAPVFNLFCRNGKWVDQRARRVDLHRFWTLREIRMLRESPPIPTFRRQTGFNPTLPL